jgi:hypothetical protein
MEENIDLSKMSNSELKLYSETLTNEFERVKNEIKQKCNKLIELEKTFNNVAVEIKTRKNIL